MSFGSASVRNRLSWVFPYFVTIAYSIAASVILTRAGKATERDCLSSRTRPISKTPGATCLTAELVVCAAPASEASKPMSRTGIPSRNGPLVGGWGGGPMKTDRGGNFIELLVADFLEPFALGSKLLVDLDRLFGHDFVRVLRATHQREVWAGGKALMTVRIQAQTEHHCLRFFLNFAGLPGHYRNLRQKDGFRQEARQVRRNSEV